MNDHGALTACFWRGQSEVLREEPVHCHVDTNSYT